jgi:hypothetical protein
MDIARLREAVPAKNLRELRVQLDLDLVGDGDFSSRGVVDLCAQVRRQEIGDVLDERSAAENVETLQSVADAEDGLAQAVGIFEEEVVDGVAAGVGSGSVRRAGGAEARRIDVGLAAGQEHGIAAGDEISNLGGSLVERDADGFASGELDSTLVLGNGALGIFGVGGVRHGDGDARHEEIVADKLRPGGGLSPG